MSTREQNDNITEMNWDEIDLSQHLPEAEKMEEVATAPPVGGAPAKPAPFIWSEQVDSDWEDDSGGVTRNEPGAEAPLDEQMNRGVVESFRAEAADAKAAQESLYKTDDHTQGRARRPRHDVIALEASRNPKSIPALEKEMKHESVTFRDSTQDLQDDEDLFHAQSLKDMIASDAVYELEGGAVSITGMLKKMVSLDPSGRPMFKRSLADPGVRKYTRVVVSAEEVPGFTLPELAPNDGRRFVSVIAQAVREKPPSPLPLMRIRGSKILVPRLIVSKEVGLQLYFQDRKMVAGMNALTFDLFSEGRVVPHFTAPPFVKKMDEGVYSALLNFQQLTEARHAQKPGAREEIAWLVDQVKQFGATHYYGFSDAASMATRLTETYDVYCQPGAVVIPTADHRYEFSAYCSTLEGFFPMPYLYGTGLMGTLFEELVAKSGGEAAAAYRELLESGKLPGRRPPEETKQPLFKMDPHSAPGVVWSEMVNRQVLESLITKAHRTEEGKVIVPAPVHRDVVWQEIAMASKMLNEFVQARAKGEEKAFWERWNFVRLTKIVPKPEVYSVKKEGHELVAKPVRAIFATHTFAQIIYLAYAGRVFRNMQADFFPVPEVQGNTPSSHKIGVMKGFSPFGGGMLAFLQRLREASVGLGLGRSSCSVYSDNLYAVLKLNRGSLYLSLDASKMEGSHDIYSMFFAVQRMLRSSGYNLSASEMRQVDERVRAMAKRVEEDAPPREQGGVEREKVEKIREARRKLYKNERARMQSQRDKRVERRKNRRRDAGRRAKEARDAAWAADDGFVVGGESGGESDSGSGGEEKEDQVQATKKQPGPAPEEEETPLEAGITAAREAVVRENRHKGKDARLTGTEKEMIQQMVAEVKVLMPQIVDIYVRQLEDTDRMAADRKARLRLLLGGHVYNYLLPYLKLREKEVYHATPRSMGSAYLAYFDHILPRVLRQVGVWNSDQIDIPFLASGVAPTFHFNSERMSHAAVGIMMSASSPKNLADIEASLQLGGASGVIEEKPRGFYLPDNYSTAFREDRLKMKIESLVWSGDDFKLPARARPYPMDVLGFDAFVTHLDSKEDHEPFVFSVLQLPRLLGALLFVKERTKSVLSTYEEVKDNPRIKELLRVMVFKTLFISGGFAYPGLRDFMAYYIMAMGLTPGAMTVEGTSVLYGAVAREALTEYLTGAGLSTEAVEVLSSITPSASVPSSLDIARVQLDGDEFERFAKVAKAANRRAGPLFKGFQDSDELQLKASDQMRIENLFGMRPTMHSAADLAVARRLEREESLPEPSSREILRDFFGQKELTGAHPFQLVLDSLDSARGIRIERLPRAVYEEAGKLPRNYRSWTTELWVSVLSMKIKDLMERRIAALYPRFASSSALLADAIFKQSYPKYTTRISRLVHEIRALGDTDIIFSEAVQTALEKLYLAKYSDVVV